MYLDLFYSLSDQITTSVLLLILNLYSDKYYKCGIAVVLPETLQHDTTRLLLSKSKTQVRELASYYDL